MSKGVCMVVCRSYIMNAVFLSLENVGKGRPDDRLS